MPKIYTEDNLRKVWVAIHDQDMRRSEVADALNVSTDEVDSMYEAARKRFRYGAPIYQYKKKREREFVPSALDRVPIKFGRVKGVYSNHKSTPYGIAQEMFNS